MSTGTHPSSAETGDEPQDQAESHTEQNAGGQWKIKRGVLVFMNDITGQAAQPERKLSAKIKNAPTSARMPATKSSVLPSSRSGSISAPAILDRFEARKEIPNLKPRGVRGVRPVRAVVADVRAEVVANSPRRRFFWIGGAHRVAPLGDGAVGFQHQRKNLAGAHEVGKLAEKWPRLVNGVKPARLLFRQPHRLGGHNLESRLMNARENFSLQAATHGVRLDNCKCSLNRHKFLLI